MKKNWRYYAACIILPHIMLIVGLILLTKADAQKRMLGKRICVISTAVLIVGSFVYYVFYTPFFGLD